MRTYTTKHTVYNFSELSEAAQDKALESLYDINISHDWFDYTFDDAKNIGLEITEFDIYRRSIDGRLLESLPDVCKAILAEHGPGTETHKLAEQWQHKHGEDNEEKFLRELLEEYLSILDKECEYLSSREAIIETIDANEYEFYEDGRMA